MTPTPEQVAQWAREASMKNGCDPFFLAYCSLEKSDVSLQVFAALVAAWQAEADAKLCDGESAQWNKVARDGCYDGRYDWKADGAEDCAAAIRANAPKA